MVDRSNLLQAIVQEQLRPHRAPIFTRSGPSPAFANHIATGEQSANIEDRRAVPLPLIKTFEFDGRTIGLDMRGPNGHNGGGQITDRQAIQKYLADGGFYGADPSKSRTNLLTAGPPRDVIDTMIAEAGGNVKGLQAVAAVINNRSSQRGLTPAAVVKEHGQFEGYSNPGRASREAQQSAHVRALAEKAWNDVTTGRVADPTNGGTEFRSASASGVLGKNTVNIGGNVFKLGNSPTNGLAAIQAAAPVPRSILPRETNAYADGDSSGAASVPLPIPRPSNPEGIRSVEINPDGTLKQSLTDALTSRYSSVIPSSSGSGPSMYAEGSGYTPAFSGAPALTSRAVQTVPIDPLTGNPVSSAPSLQDALNAKAALMAQQRSIIPSINVANGTAGVGASRGALIPSFIPQQNSGAIKTLGQAANVALLPQNVVPASVQRDLQTIAPRLINSSGSPDDRQMSPVIAPASLPVAQAPIPMPGRPVSLSSSSPTLAQRNSNDVVQSVPYVAPASPKQNYTDTTNPLNIDRLGLTVGPPAPRVTTAQQAITQAAANPSTTYTYKQMQVSNPAYEKYIAAQGADDIGAGPGSFASLQSALATIAPPKTITQTVRVPVSTPRLPSPTSVPLSTFGTVNPMTQIVPNVQSGIRSTPAGHLWSFLNGEPVQGGLLSLLNGRNPLGGVFAGGSQTPSVPAPAAGANFLADRGVSTVGTTIGQQANDLNKLLAGGSRNPDGSRGFM